MYRELPIWTEKKQHIDTQQKKVIICAHLWKKTYIVCFGTSFSGHRYIFISTPKNENIHPEHIGWSEDHVFCLCFDAV